jgi:hypothetical protein
MVWGEVKEMMNRLLASLATNSTNSTVYLSPQDNPEGGLRASGSGGSAGGWRKNHENANWITAYVLARSVLKVGWRLAKVREDVEGRMSRLFLATNSTMSTVNFFPQEEWGLGERGKGGGLKNEPRECEMDNYSLLVGEVGPEGGLETGNGARGHGGENE